MPAVRFKVRWPDGGIDSCYSPSTIIKTYFIAGHSYTMSEFLTRCREGLQAASDRVRVRYGGSGCVHAMATLATIEATAKRHGSTDAIVKIEGFDL